MDLPNRPWTNSLLLQFSLYKGTSTLDIKAVLWQSSVNGKAQAGDWERSSMKGVFILEKQLARHPCCPSYSSQLGDFAFFLNKAGTIFGLFWE